MWVDGCDMQQCYFRSDCTVSWFFGIVLPILVCEKLQLVFSIIQGFSGLWRSTLRLLPIISQISSKEVVLLESFVAIAGSEV